MTPTGTALTHHQRQAALLEAAGGDRETAAHGAGVSVKTISRWRMRTDYRAAVEEARGSAESGPAGALQSELALGASEAVRAVRDLLRAEMKRDEPDANLVTAAARVLVGRAPSSHAPRPQPSSAVVKLTVSKDGELLGVDEGGRR